VGEGGLWGWIRGGAGKLGAGGSGNGLEKEIERERKKERGKELRWIMEGADKSYATGWGTYRTGEGISVKGEDATIVPVAALVFDTKIVSLLISRPALFFPGD
jgi:hypothetical protein